MKKYRYVIITMIVLMTMINYIDRGSISYAQADIIKEFGFDKVAWGSILGYFGYGYMLGSLFGGILSDKKGPKFVWIVAGTLWSVFEMAMAFAGELGLAVFGGSALAGFGVLRVLFGFSEGPLFSTMNKTNANWAAPKERGLLSALGLIGVPLGALITAPIASFLLSVTTWRVLFILMGALGIVWVIIWSKMFTNYPEDHPKVSKEELAAIRSTDDTFSGEKTVETEDSSNERWYHFFKSPTLICNTIGYFGFQYINFLVLTWTPKYLQDEYHFEIHSLWYLGMIPWIGAVFTAYFGGRLSDWLRTKTGNLWIARSGLSIFGMILAAICFLIIPMTNSVPMIMFLMMLGVAFLFLPNAVYWAVVIDTAPKNAGTYGGITHFFVNSATIIAPTLTGILVSSYGYKSMFISAVVSAVIGIVAMIFVRPGYKKMSKQA
ncbi:MFS transporter [Staphylococcus pettenkoferi]|uniref:MFS transporter n=1 Tax=Staphylococcus pettenkoferi TaxID=170573 RepID=UPI00066D12BB|nr:MFS transporter [Staphylococcus pettenkoferi]MDK7114973.1 MFS transporter [Staphylococcus pettenkoferi]MDK7283366.1 MFS transporter [Staphylococcus pettenkoferi]